MDRKCPLDPFIVEADGSSFYDTQKFKMQEAPDDTPTGEMPRHVWLFADRKLVNAVKPGSRVNCIGIYKTFDSSLSNKNDRFDVSVRFFFCFFILCFFFIFQTCVFFLVLRYVQIINPKKLFKK